MSDPVTRCPSCLVAFKASRAQLQAANGLVRCGACLNIFDAYQHINKTSTPGRVPAESGKTDAVEPEILIDDNLDPEVIASLGEAGKANSRVDFEFQPRLSRTAGNVGATPTSPEQITQPEGTAAGNKLTSSFSTGSIESADEQILPVENGRLEPASLRSAESGSELIPELENRIDDDKGRQQHPGADNSRESLIRAVLTISDPDKFEASDFPDDIDVNFTGTPTTSVPVKDSGIAEAGSRRLRDSSDFALRPQSTDAIVSLPLTPGFPPAPDLQEEPPSRTVAHGLSRPAVAKRPPAGGITPAPGNPTASKQKNPDAASGFPAADPLFVVQHSWQDRFNPPSEAGTKARKVHWRPTLAWLWYPLVAIGLLGLVVQYTYFNVDQLGMNPAYRPWLETFCDRLNCQLPIPVDRSQIATRDFVVRSHPGYENGLLVDAVIINNAGFDQPFPQLTLQFEDLQGEVVAQRHFKPEEYLRGELTGAVFMPVNQAVRLELEILDPGDRAVSFSLFIPE